MPYFLPVTSRFINKSVDPSPEKSPVSFQVSISGLTVTWHFPRKRISFFEKGQAKTGYALHDTLLGKMVTVNYF